MAGTPPPVPCGWYVAEVDSRDLRNVFVRAGEPALIALCTQTARDWQRFEDPELTSGEFEARPGVWVTVEALESPPAGAEGSESPPSSSPEPELELPDFGDKSQFKNKGALVAFAKDHDIDIDPTARRSVIERALAEALEAKEEADG